MGLIISILWMSFRKFQKIYFFCENKKYLHVIPHGLEVHPTQGQGSSRKRVVISYLLN